MLETLARLVAAEILVVAAVACAYVIVMRLLPEASGAMRWTAAGSVALWMATVLFHALAAPGAFRLSVALAGAVAVLAWMVWTGVFPRSLDLGPIASVVRRRTLFGGLVLVACACAVAIATRGLLVPVVAWDSTTYHAVKAGMWVQGGGYETFSAPGSFGIYRTYPGNGEIVHAWAMLPMRSDLLVGLADVFSWILLGIAFWALAEKLGVDAGGRAIGVGYLLAVPAVARAVGSLYVDTTLAACLVGACVLALHARAERSPVALALAFAALGVGCGVKVTALPVAAAVCVLAVLVAWKRAGSRRILWLMAGALAFLAAAAPWYVRARHLTGLPFSPIPLRVGGLVLGQPNDAMRWYLERPQLAGAGIENELRAAAQLLGIPGFVPLSEPTLGMLTPLVAALGIVGLVALARREWPSALVVGAVALTAGAPYFGAGLRATRLIWPRVSGRYLIAALAVLLATSLLVGPSTILQRAYRLVLGLGVVAYLVLSDFAGWTWYESLTAAGAALLLGSAVALVRGSTSRASAAAVLVLPLLGGLALATYRDATHERALRESVVLHPSPRYWLPAALAVDDPTTSRRIAVTAGPAHNADNWHSYPFLGRSLQNELVYVPPTADGTTIDPSRREELWAAASYPAWIERLDAAGVVEVMSFSPASLELAWMERHPEAFERLAGDRGHWGLYRRSGG